MSGKGFRGVSKYAPGSFKEVCFISYPLMLTLFSSTFMVFCDRVVLARYSLDAMNAVALTSMIYTVFSFFGSGITSIAEVFVGQYNGKREYNKLASPVWQMIWFSLIYGVVLWPIVFSGLTYNFIPEPLLEYGVPYLKILLYFAFIPAMISAINSFYIGQGKVKIITISAIVANVINVILAVILVFGVDGFIPSLGPVGSAIATVIALFVQFGIVAFCFFRESNVFRAWAFNYNMFIECLKTGFPVAGSHLLELSAWGVLGLILGHFDIDYLTVNNIASTFFICIALFTDGLKQAITVIAANMLGGNAKSLIKTLLRSSVTLHCSVAILLSIPMVFFPDLAIKLFTSDEVVISASLYEHLVLAIFLFWLYYVIDGFVWVVAGVLTAGGDTRFILYVNAVCVWTSILAIYIAITNFATTPSTPFWFFGVYAAVNLAFFIARYRSGKWNKLHMDA